MRSDFKSAFVVGSAFLSALTVPVIVADKYDDDDVCPRFCPEELKATVFDPVMEKEIKFLETTYDLVLEGVKELLSGIKERGPKENEEDIKKLIAGVSNLEQTKLILFSRATAGVEAAWRKVFAYHGDPEKADRPLIEMRHVLMGVHHEIHAIQKNMDKPFEDLVQASKAILDPIVKLLKAFLRKVEDTEEKKAELLKRLQEKNYLLGRVMEKVIRAELDGVALSLPQHVFRSNHMWSQVTIAFFRKGLAREDLEGEEFWKVVLEALWAENDYRDRYDCDEGETEEECDHRERIDLLSSIMYHTEWLDDKRLPEIE